MEIIKKEYMQLLSSGIFWKLFPWMTGDWNDDKTAFIEIYLDEFKNINYSNGNY